MTADESPRHTSARGHRPPLQVDPPRPLRFAPLPFRIPFFGACTPATARRCGGLCHAIRHHRDARQIARGRRGM